MRPAECVLLCLLLCLPVFAQGARQPDQAKLQAVADGKLTEAKASSWGFSPEDSTDQLQAALDSGVPKLTIDDVGAPWITRPLTLRSNQAITFERGVELRAKEGAYKGGNDCLLSAVNVEKISLSGPGATLRMRRSDYDQPELYKKAEWRHCLQIKSSQDITVVGLTLAESGGDGIYLGTSRPGVTNTNIIIRDVVCDRNYRQGISVITAENLLIENTVMRDTDGTNPRAGIDFEPNRPGERLVNVVMRNCVSENNAGCGYVLYVKPMNSTSEPISVTLENCRATGNKGAAFALMTGDSLVDAVDGFVTLKNCTLESDKAALVAITKPAERTKITLSNCTLSTTGNPRAPIILSTGQHADAPAGGVALDNCLIDGAPEGTPITYVDRGGGIPLVDLTGTLRLQSNGAERTVKLTKEQLAEWIPITAMRMLRHVSLDGLTLAPVAPVNADGYPFGYARIRGAGSYVVWAKAGNAVALEISQQQVGKYGGGVMDMVVTGPDGQETTKGKAEFQAVTPLSFTAPVTGVYLLTGDAGRNWWSIAKSSHPVALLGEGGPIHLISAAGDYWFRIPKGTTEFGVRVSGEGLGEAVKATLLNAKGEVVGEVDNQIAVHQFEVRLDQPSAGESWCLQLRKPSAMPMEDMYVDLRCLPQLLSPAEDSVLAPE